MVRFFSFENSTARFCAVLESGNLALRFCAVFRYCKSYGAVRCCEYPTSVRFDVATGAWVKSKHDMYLIRGSVGA